MHASGRLVPAESQELSCQDDPNYTLHRDDAEEGARNVVSESSRSL